MKRLPIITQYRILLVWPLIAAALALFLQVNYPMSQVLFWGIPALTLTFWAHAHAKKAALFAVALSILAMAFDLIFYVTGQWYVFSSLQTRLFGIVAWEDIPYFFLFIYFPVLFWEHFLEHHSRERAWRKRMTKFLAVVILVFALVACAWRWSPELLQIPYFYAICMMIIAVIPLALQLGLHPKLGPKFFQIGIYFAYVAILYEVTSISLGHWNYPSDQFIGWVELFGQRFPFEELVTWILIGAPAVLAWYEYLDDDNR